MKPICEMLTVDLELYADGELLDRRRLLRVRRHLERCPFCRRRLQRQDALVRRLLAGAEPAEGFEHAARGDASCALARGDGPAPGPLARNSSRQRQLAILRRIEALPSPTAVPLRCRPAPGESSFVRLRIVLPAAAALVVATLLALSVWGPGSTQHPDPYQRARIQPDRVEVSSRVQAPGPVVARQGRSLTDLLWAHGSAQLAAEMGLPAPDSGTIILHALQDPDVSPADDESAQPGGKLPWPGGSLPVVVGEPLSFDVDEWLLLVPAEFYENRPLDQATRKSLSEAVVSLVPRQVARLAGWSARAHESRVRRPRRVYRIVPAAAGSTVPQLPATLPSAHWSPMPWMTPKESPPIDGWRPRVAEWSTPLHR